MKSNQSNDTLIAMITTCTLALASASQAKTFFVSPGGSIQDAVNAAADSPGADNVLLRPGVYFENEIEIKDDDPLTLRGTGDVTINGIDKSEDVIKIDGGDVTIHNVAITNGDDGIDAKNADLTVQNVAIFKNDDEGVETSKMGSVIIKNSDFSDNGGDGIQVEKADSVLIINASSTLNDDGFDLEDVTSVTLHNVVVSESDDDGLEVDDCDLVRVTHGTFNTNGDDGIDIDDAVEITLNSVISTGNVGSGFQAEAETVETEQITVVKGRFADNGDDGVQLVEDGKSIGDVTLKSVDALTNTGSGLNIQASGTVTKKSVVSGTAAGNTTPDVP